MLNVPAIARSALPATRRLVAQNATTIFAAGSITLLTAAMLFVQLDHRQLWPTHEARAAQEAAGLLETGDFGVLRLFDGTPDYQKPPLFYWLVAAVAWLRGGIVDEWSVRLPAASAGALVVIGVGIWLWQRGRPFAAVVAVCSLLCATHFVATSRTGRIDAPLMLATFTATLCWVANRRVCAGVALGAAFMLKGPVALLIVLPIVVSYLGRRTSVLPLVIGLSLAAPWFVYATAQTSGEYAWSFFWHHNIERATGSSSDLASHPAWYYLLRWAIDWLPATPAVLVAGWYACRNRVWTNDRELKLGLMWALGVTAILSCARFKRADYLLPAYPGLAILVGCIAEHALAEVRLRRRTYIVGGSTLAASLTMAIVYEAAIVPRENLARGRASIAAEVGSLREPNQPIIMFRVEDHLLTFHLGKPVHFIREWENLDIWVSRLPNGLVILNADDAASWTQHVNTGTLREVCRHHDKVRSREIVVMESCPHWIAECK